MAQQNRPPVTQRAYTLRLRGTDPNDESLRDALWQTHEAVNKGAKVFGDWLLTLRGGLDHNRRIPRSKVGRGNLTAIRPLISARRGAFRWPCHGFQWSQLLGLRRILS